MIINLRINHNHYLVALPASNSRVYLRICTINNAIRRRMWMRHLPWRISGGRNRFHSQVKEKIHDRTVSASSALLIRSHVARSRWWFTILVTQIITARPQTRTIRTRSAKCVIDTTLSPRPRLATMQTTCVRVELSVPLIDSLSDYCRTTSN